MCTTEEGWHTTSDNVKLYTKSWLAPFPPSATILFLHGFSDHSNRYGSFFPALAARGITIHAFDQRGWGRSVQKPSDRGLTGPTSQVLADITSVLKSHLPCPTPLFLMGHSMGGSACLYYAARGPPDVTRQIAGFLASSPLIGLHPDAQPARITVVLGRLAGRLLPRRQMVNKLDSRWMCHDAAVCKDWEEDELCHDTGTLEGLAGMLDRMAELDGGRVGLREWDGLRVWVGHGTEDRCTSFERSRAWVEGLAVGDKTFRAYEGCYHCVHLEPGEGKELITNDVADWVLAKAKLASQRPGSATEAQSKL